MKWKRAPWGSLILFGAIVLALSGCGGSGSGPTHESSEIRQAVFTLPGSPTVDVATSSGRVTIRGQAGLTEVRVTSTLRNRGASLQQAEGRVREMVVHATQEGQRVVLRYDGSEQPEVVREHGSVDFELTMPILGDVFVDVDDGAIDVENLEGTIAVETRNGAIAATDIVGTLDVRTDNGSIDATRMQGVLRADSNNGRLRMTEIEGSIDAETGHGNVLFSGRPAGASHRIRAAMGTVEVELPSDLSITIDASASDGISADGLRFEGDTEGRSWHATLNPPAGAMLELFTSNGRIELRAAE